MPATVASSPASAHRLLSEIRPDRMAKADLKKIETTFRADIGRCVAKARQALGWSQKDLASAIEAATHDDRDVAQLSRWEAGSERPQFDVLWSVEALRGPLVIALAGLADGFEIVTEIRVRRTA